MRLLALGVVLDIYLVGIVVTHEWRLSLAGAGLSASCFLLLWYIFPKWTKHRKGIKGGV